MVLLSLLTWTLAQAGPQPMNVRVSDGIAWTELSWTINVTPASTELGAVINITPLNQVVAGTPYQYAVVASDPEGTALSYELVQAPAGATLSASGLLSSASHRRKWARSP